MKTFNIPVKYILLSTMRVKARSLKHAQHKIINLEISPEELSTIFEKPKFLEDSIELD